MSLLYAQVHKFRLDRKGINDMESLNLCLNPPLAPAPILFLLSAGSTARERLRIG